MDITPEEKQRIRENIEKLKQSKFKQQTLPAWRPIPTLVSSMIQFSIFGVIFLGIGIGLQITNNQIDEIVIRYDNHCQDLIQTGSKCELSLNNLQKFRGTAYVYYQLDNFYQNHRRYVKSRENDQLNGKYLSVSELSNCDPIITVGDLWVNQKTSVNGKMLQNTQPAIPCGLVAKSYFNDTFQLYRVYQNMTREEIQIYQKNIAWNSDVEQKFKNVVPKDGVGSWEDIQWLDMTNEHFIVWMRSSGLPNFRKLWGKIVGGLPHGDYILVVDNEYEVKPFSGKKSFVISTMSSMGGKNPFLAIAYIIAGCFCIVLAIGFCIIQTKTNQQATEEKRKKDNLPMTMAGMKNYLKKQQESKVDLLTPQEQNCVKETWQRLRQNDSSFIMQGTLLFQILLESYPDLQQIFLFKDLENKVFKRHASGIILVIDRCVRDLQGSVAELEKLGKRHQSRGLKEQHFQYFGQALIQTINQFQGERPMSEEQKNAWIKLYGIIATAMKKHIKF